jgi:hypothetical protein
VTARFPSRDWAQEPERRDKDRPLTAAGPSTAAEKGVCRIFGLAALRQVR